MNNILKQIPQLIFMCCCFFSLITTTYALDWNLKSGDTRMTGEALKSLVVGKIVVFSGNNGKEYYRSNGTYLFEYRGKQFPSKSYNIRSDGSRCLTTVTGNRRCDLYVMRKKTLWLINQRGQRYKAKVK